jgi:hypothetical protein
MTTTSESPGTSGRSAVVSEPPPGHAAEPALPPFEWGAARRAGRACCCPAKPAVIAVMPPSPGRAHPTDLLLCGHHYRVSRQALAAVGALVLDTDGLPVAELAWH